MGSLARLLLLLLLALLGTNHPVDGGCSGRCCRGTDSACSSTDWRSDRVYGTCYCDESCHRTGDCCFDYPTMCPAQPCVVGQWSPWSRCSHQCRPAFRERRRRVEQESRNSGDACPPLEERAGCLEYRDTRGRSCAQTQGPALITTVEHSKGRARRDPRGEPPDPGFCVEFRMESLSPHCTGESQPHTRWTQYLREGHTVCAACQPPAMHNRTRGCQGDGATSSRGERQLWQAVGNPRCRGTWTKVQRVEHCACPAVHTFLFT